MSNRKSPISDFIKGIGIPESNGSSSVEIIGNNKVIIECTKKIVEYTSERIRLNLGVNFISVCGKNLALCSYSDHVTIIDGVINSLTFE